MPQMLKKPNPENEIVLNLAVSIMQYRFLYSKKKYVGYGGARGGGKSWSVRTKATLLSLQYPGIKILIVRRTYAELENNHIIPLRESLAKLARYNKTEKRFYFPNGSTIKFGYCNNDNDLMIINRSGITIRTAVSGIRVAGRATQGVRIINLRDGDVIASVMAVPVSDEEEIEENVVVTEGAEATAEVAAEATSEQAAAPEQTATEE